MQWSRQSEEKARVMGIAPWSYPEFPFWFPGCSQLYVYTPRRPIVSVGAVVSSLAPRSTSAAEEVAGEDGVKTACDALEALHARNSSQGPQRLRAKIKKGMTSSLTREIATPRVSINSAVPAHCSQSRVEGETKRILTRTIPVQVGCKACLWKVLPAEAHSNPIKGVHWYEAS